MEVVKFKYLYWEIEIIDDVFTADDGYGIILTECDMKVVEVFVYSLYLI